MEIRLNTNIGPVSKPTDTSSKGKVGQTGSDGVAFDSSQALESSLAATPDIRPDVVARGRSLAADPAYPPAETINKISNLLAMHLREAENRE